MTHWNKLDWYCPQCKKNRVTTEHCSPASTIEIECECGGRHHHELAGCRCHECGQELERGACPCYHLAENSQAV
ncbi:MAG: hypothetical protein NDJ89_10440 [Oligoflexia bacterium]|nr:hypothetical protein [Oligoflexia bacterium]